MEIKERLFEQLCQGSSYLYHTRLVGGKAGNISVRIPGTNYIAITPSSVSYELYTKDIMCVVDAEGNLIEGKYRPSSETPMHTMIMKALPEINAIVHTHSPYATTFAVLGAEIPVLGIEGLKFGTQKILPTDGFITPGSNDMGDV